MSQWWSWLLAAIGLSGVFLAGNSRKLGWAIGVGVQVLWLAYAVTSRQWGFLVSAIGYGGMYGRNWWRWHRAEQAAEIAREVGR